MAIKHDNCKNCSSRCIHAGKDRDFVCVNGVSCKITTEKPQTNADRIRAMSDENLAAVFKTFCTAIIDRMDCMDCPLYRFGCPGNSNFNDWIKWLQQPAE